MKLLTQTIVLAIAMAVSAGAMAQAPTNATRQRKATTNVTNEAMTQTTPGDPTTPTEAGPFSEPTPAINVSAKANGEKNRCRSRLSRSRSPVAWSVPP